MWGRGRRLCYGPGWKIYQDLIYVWLKEWRKKQTWLIFQVEVSEGTCGDATGWWKEERSLCAFLCLAHAPALPGPASAPAAVPPPALVVGAQPYPVQPSPFLRRAASLQPDEHLVCSHLLCPFPWTPGVFFMCKENIYWLIFRLALKTVSGPWWALPDWAETFTVIIS